MKRQIVFKGIRLDEMLAVNCALAATKAHMHFSEWARQAFLEKLKRTGTTGRKA